LNKKSRRSPFDDDFGSFGLGFDFQKIIDEMNAMINNAGPHRVQTQGKPIYYGYSVEIGPDGKPHVKEFGNVRPVRNDQGGDVNACGSNENSCGCNNTTPEVESLPREEISDDSEVYACSMYDEKKNEIKIHADIPGISKEDIDLRFEDHKLILNAKNENKSYHKVIPLDREVTEKDIKANYNNGVLEITLKCKKQAKKEQGKKIKVE
jgi:HSP20 family protein